MTIRFAGERDIPAMIRLLRQVGQVHHDIRPDLFRSGAQKYNEEELAALLADRDRPIFIAEEDGAVLGYCFCILQETRDHPVLCDDKALYIDDLCVDETARGRRVGRALYEHTLAYARERGCGRITLNVWWGNDALKFYKRLGLTPQKIGMEFKLC